MIVSKRPKARIGMVSYLNTAPVHETWKSTMQGENWQFVEDTPVALYKKLADGQIDMGFVSSYEYGRHADKYRILSGLSISVNGPVGAVYLFSHIPMEQLDQETILYSAQSVTSVSLAKIILEKFHKVHPQYLTGNLESIDAQNSKAVLAIHDDAQRLALKSTYLYEYDLADIWKRETGLPFVFFICVVREEFCAANPELLQIVHKEFIRCRDEGLKGLKDICEIAAPRIPMTKDKCIKYLSVIEYDLDVNKRKSLETFFNFLIERGDIEKSALPLKIIANLH